MFELINTLINAIYWFCVDFIINIGNLLGLSYIEINTILFLILFPMYTLILLVMIINQHLHINRLRKADQR